MHVMKRLRLALGMSQVAFAEALGAKSRSTVGAWETRGAKPREQTLQRAHELFGEKAAELGFSLPEPEPESEVLGCRPPRPHRVEHKETCERCSVDIIWYEWRRGVYESKPGADGDEGVPDRFRLCVRCTSETIYLRAVKRRAANRYDILHHVGLI